MHKLALVAAVGASFVIGLVIGVVLGYQMSDEHEEEMYSTWGVTEVHGVDGMDEDE